MSVQKVEVQGLCEKIYQVVEDRWKSFEIELPQAPVPSEYYDNPVPRYSEPREPTIRDLDFSDEVYVPKNIKAFFNRYAEALETDAVPLPSDSWRIHGFFPPNPREDPYSFIPVYDYYGEWVEYFNRMWKSKKTKFIGWRAAAYDVPSGRTYTFNLSPRGAVNKLAVERPTLYQKVKFRPAFEPSLYTVASFRGGSLVRFWHEEVNGTLFLDPKGEMDQIWPKWTRWQPEYDEDTGLSPEEDWEIYLGRVRARRPVISGKTDNFVLQTERQAVENLERWREYIYKKSPQVLFFRRITTEPWFVGAAGYKAYGEYGQYLAKNPQSYRELDFSQAEQHLLNWVP